MSILLITHPDCVNHETPTGHPECPARLTRVLAALDAPRFASLAREEAPLANLDDIRRVHESTYVAEMLAPFEPSQGHRCRRLNTETYASAGSAQAALRAAGAALRGVDALFAGSAAHVFCAIRPPGHHAEPAKAMGFCIFNNVGVAAAYARARHGVRRVAVVDFDVHHGNGTQAMFEDDADLMYISTHQVPLYPGTGLPSEVGVANNIMNIPLASGDGSEVFRGAMAGRALPALDAFAPELLIISAGFDAHRADPLGALTLTEDDYVWITGCLAACARKHSKVGLLSSLEGGYDLDALALSVAAHVGALMEAAA